jgi:DNA polymerase
VLCRGSIPCDVLLIGEAPGASEDVIGQPFVGPAGHLLDEQVENVMKNLDFPEISFCFTNLVCCIPKVHGRKITEPMEEHVDSCQQRRLEFIQLCQPKIIVSVGDLAYKYLERDELETVKITHPAAILRAEVVRQGLMYQKVVVTLENAIRDLLDGQVH